MARMNIGGKRVTQDAIEKWKVERGYNKPLFLNTKESGLATVTDTIFYERSVQLFAFQFGSSDSGRDIGYELRQRVEAIARAGHCSIADVVAELDRQSQKPSSAG